MPDDDFVIGEVYYQIGFARVVKEGDVRIVLSAWRYDGIETRSYSSKTCDAPNHFLFFTCVTGEVDAFDPANRNRIGIPSRAGARVSMLTWRQLRAEVVALGDDGVDGDEWHDE